ncbi:hypothetical protein PS2_019574 [Malus domestica]
MPQNPISPGSHHKQASMKDNKIKKQLQEDQAIYREGAMLINRNPGQLFYGQGEHKSDNPQRNENPVCKSKG